MLCPLTVYPLVIFKTYKCRVTQQKNLTPYPCAKINPSYFFGTAWTRETWWRSLVCTAGHKDHKELILICYSEAFLKNLLSLTFGAVWMLFIPDSFRGKETSDTAIF